MIHSGDGPDVFDENGADAFYEDWLWGCKVENQAGIASNGERVTTALALRIAHEMLRYLVDGNPQEPPSWTERDLRLARAAIAGVRAQQGVFSEDSKMLGHKDGLFATHQIDIWVYG